MDTKSFTSLLRKIIREEVRSAVREEMKTLLNERKTDHKQVIQHGTRLHHMTELDINHDPDIPRSYKPKQFVKNSMLNDLLNETALTSSDIEQDWPEMNFQTEQSQLSVAPALDQNYQPVNMQNPNVASTVNAMTRDYTALMKAIDKKKGIN